MHPVHGLRYAVNMTGPRMFNFASWLRGSTARGIEATRKKLFGGSWSNPQNTQFADKPGEYRLAVRSTEAEVAPGSKIDLEIYITGYGQIRGPKIVFYPPKYFISSVAQGGWALTEAAEA